MLPLPPSVTSRLQFSPIEDIMLAVLRDAFPDIKVGTRVELDTGFPFILVRGTRSPVGWGGDQRFVDVRQIELQVYTQDPDGDEAGSLISEAVRVALFDAWRNNFHVPGRGWINHIKMSSPPHEVPDWATATGPVQYADLPSGIFRYETRYTVEVRREL